MNADQSSNPRYEAGLKQLRRVDGPHGVEVVEQLQREYPQLAAYIVEFPFGTVYENLRLDLKSAELCVVAMLAALGTARPQLKVHVAAALHVGASAAEVQQMIYQSAIYAGFPAAINATFAAKEVFVAGGVEYVEPAITSETPEQWRKRGSAYVEALKPGLERSLSSAYSGVGERVPQYVTEFAFGRVVSRDGLDRRRRQLGTVAMLAAIGVTEQLTFHVGAAKHWEITVEELEDVMYLVSVYAGFPRAINGMNVIKAAFR